MRRDRLNDHDRQQWIENDEGLYNWQRRSGLPIGQFIKQNRQAIDEVILAVRTGQKPAHYLAYGR